MMLDSERSPAARTPTLPEAKEVIIPTLYGKVVGAIFVACVVVIMVAATFAAVRALL